MRGLGKSFCEVLCGDMVYMSEAVPGSFLFCSFNRKVLNVNSIRSNQVINCVNKRESMELLYKRNRVTTHTTPETVK